MMEKMFFSEALAINGRAPPHPPSLLRSYGATGLSILASVVILLVTAGYTPLLAASPKAPEQKDASVRPVYEQDGKFGFCLYETFYDDGRSFAVALSPSDKINIGIMIPGAGFALGGHYDLGVSLDQINAQAGKPYNRTIRAAAIDANSLVFQMGRNAAFEKALVNANNLYVEGGGRKITFALPSVEPLLGKLRACNKSHKGKTNKAAANAEKALPASLKALLVTAGLTNIAPMRMDDVPADQRPADFMWRTGPLIGGVRERLVPKDKSFSELVGFYLQGLKDKCGGTFEAETSRDVKEAGLTVQDADIVCRMKDANGDKSIAASILFYLTASQKLTVFTHEARLGDAPQARAARDRLRDAVLNLARKTNKSP